MLFRQSIKQELSQVASASFVTLLTIVITTALIRSLGQAAAGEVDNASVLSLILFSSMNYLGVVLVLTTFISVMVVVSRAFRDQEMTVWLASGVPLTHWVRPVLRFSVPMMILAMAFTVEVSPWAKRQNEDIKERFKARSDVSKVSPGQFRESSDGSRIFFIERESPDKGVVENIFVATRDGDRLSLIVSDGGRVETAANGERYIVLNSGRRFDLTKQTTNFSALSFERYGIRLEPGFYLPPDTTSQSADVQVLLAKNTADSRGELLWRFSLPISGLLLSVLAIPLSFVNIRGGRSLNLIVALLIYLFYSNCLSIAQAWVSQGKAGFWAAFLTPHLIASFVVMVLLFRRNHQNVGWGRWLLMSLRRQKGRS